MGLFDLFRRKAAPVVSAPEEPVVKTTVYVGAKNEETERKDYQSYNNSNITFSGELAGYDYDSILRNKQANIMQLYQLSDYYTDADPLVHGIIKHVYVPFTMSSPWMLTGSTQKTRKIYEEFYKQIRLREKLSSIILEFWKYANVFVYIYKGVPITLPPMKCRIGNVSFNGEPIVDFDCQSIYNEWREKNYVVKDNWIKDNNLETYFAGFPEEDRKALTAGQQYAQLNPKYCKVLQADKESWQRYAIPFIASCLPALAKKELINKYEVKMLDLGIHSFVHARYGDEKKGADMLPEMNQLREARNVFSRAMNNFPLAVTNQLAKAEVVQPDLDNLFQFDKYRDVNNDILASGGVSGILVTGISEDGSTFASAQVSMQTAAARIEACRDEICELMNKINVCIQEELGNSHTYNVAKIPEFRFMPLDMAGRKALRDACNELWEKGVVSTKTMMETNGYSMDEEVERRNDEASNGTDETLVPRDITNMSFTPTTPSNTQDDGGGDVGRPEMTDEERNSDPDAARRGKQPKPSNPEGSMGDESV